MIKQRFYVRAMCKYWAKAIKVVSKFAWYGVEFRVYKWRSSGMDLPSAPKTSAKRRLTILRWFKYRRLLALRRSKKSNFKIYFHWLLLACIIIPILTIDGCSKTTKSKSKDKVAAIPVLVTTAQLADVPVYIAALGSVTPLNSVIIKTQVNGQLFKLLFEEGQMVEANALLAQIDPRPYEAQLLQYEGQLARDQALLFNARLDLQRYKTLITQDSTSQQVLDTQIALVKQYEGAVKTDEGQINAVRLNLIYCNITSPINGRIGLRQVDPGNLIQTSDVNGIVVVNTTRPIYVVFSITEDDVPRVAQKIAEGKTLTVEAQDRAQNKVLAIGNLLTMDNQIDATTGTIKLKAIFSNENDILFPNQFVNAQLLVDTLHGATVVPTTAIQHGVKGDFVYLLNSNQTVSMKAVSVVGSIDEHSAISGEIKPGDMLVIEGADKLKDGAAVTVITNNNRTTAEHNNVSTYGKRKE
jgi:multidrug efflux system membrane fusion protein